MCVRARVCVGMGVSVTNSPHATACFGQSFMEAGVGVMGRTGEEEKKDKKKKKQ